MCVVCVCVAWRNVCVCSLVCGRACVCDVGLGIVCVIVRMTDCVAVGVFVRLDVCV